jgi:hypothetical protein
MRVFQRLAQRGFSDFSWRELVMLLQMLPIVLERGETALAEVVLDAQDHAQAETDEKSLPSLVWNDIRDSVQVRGAVRHP